MRRRRPPLWCDGSLKVVVIWHFCTNHQDPVSYLLQKTTHSAGEHSKRHRPAATLTRGGHRFDMSFLVN
jgi:hypothetical protein